MTEQEGDFDPDTRWALVWFEQAGFAEGEFGVAETLSRAKNTSVSGMVDAGVVRSGGGKVRLLRPSELQDDWDPTSDSRTTVWEAVHQIVNALRNRRRICRCRSASRARRLCRDCPRTVLPTVHHV